MERKNCKETFELLLSEMSKRVNMTEKEIMLGREHEISLYRSLVAYMLRQSGFSLRQIAECFKRTPASAFHMIKKISSILLNEDGAYFPKVTELQSSLRVFTLPPLFAVAMRAMGASDEDMLRIWDTMLDTLD